MIKPRVPIINGANPITKKLFMDYAFYERGGTKVMDIAGKINTTLTGTTWITELFGPVLKFPGGAGTDLINLGNKTPTTQLSVVALIYLVGTDVTMRRLSTWSGTEVMFGINSTNVTVQFNFSGANGAWTFSNPTTGVWHLFVCSYDGSSVSNMPNVWIDAIPQTLTQTSIPVGTKNSSIAQLVIGSNTAGTACWNGYIGFYRRFSRTLIAQEANQLYVNPWQTYIQPPM